MYVGSATLSAPTPPPAGAHEFAVFTAAVATPLKIAAEADPLQSLSFIAYPRRPVPICQR
jgi:hypothetical protein